MSNDTIDDDALFDAVVTVCTEAAAEGIRAVNPDAPLGGLREEIEGSVRGHAAAIRKRDPGASDEEVLLRAVTIHLGSMALRLGEVKRHNADVERFERTERVAEVLALRWIGNLDVHEATASGDHAFISAVERIYARARLAAQHLDVQSRIAARTFNEEK